MGRALIWGDEAQRDQALWLQLWDDGSISAPDDLRVGPLKQHHVDERYVVAKDLGGTYSVAGYSERFHYLFHVFELLHRSSDRAKVRYMFSFPVRRYPLEAWEMWDSTRRRRT